MSIPSRLSKTVKEVSKLPETYVDVELALLGEEAQQATEALGWAGVFKEGGKTSAEVVVCSESKVIAVIRERVEHLVDLVESQAFSSPNVRRIVQFLDDYLRKTGRPHLTPAEANSLLAEEELLQDSPSSPGEPLRRLLRADRIPHAFKRSNRWFIPHSLSDRSQLQKG